MHACVLAMQRGSHEQHQEPTAAQAQVPSEPEWRESSTSKKKINSMSWNLPSKKRREITKRSWRDHQLLCFRGRCQSTLLVQSWMFEKVLVPSLISFPFHRHEMIRSEGNYFVWCMCYKLQSRLFFFFFFFCRTWTKRFLITSQTRVKRVSRIHHRTILDGPVVYPANAFDSRLRGD